MDGYTFDEGIAFLVLVKASVGVINHLKATHNRSHLHSEIHKQLRFPHVKEILRKNRGNFPLISQNFPNREPEPTPQGSDDSNRGLQPTADQPESTDDASDSQRVPEPLVPEPVEGAEGPEVPRPEVSRPASTDIILTKEDVHSHKHTRLEDMPNDLCRTLWLKRQDVYREMQQAHMKMRAVPEGEEHNEERAKWRAEVLRLDAENDSYWKQIDAEIERFNAEKERANEKADKNDQVAFDVSTYRSYISKALRKKQLTPAQLSELQHRVDAMLEAKVEMKPETLEKLKAIGITVG